jgi:hypothetical protein
VKNTTGIQLNSSEFGGGRPSVLDNLTMPQRLFVDVGCFHFS